MLSFLPAQGLNYHSYRAVNADSGFPLSNCKAPWKQELSSSLDSLRVSLDQMPDTSLGQKDVKTLFAQASGVTAWKTCICPTGNCALSLCFKDLFCPPPHCPFNFNTYIMLPTRKATCKLSCTEFNRSVTPI